MRAVAKVVAKVVAMAVAPEAAKAVEATEAVMEVVGTGAVGRVR